MLELFETSSINGMGLKNRFVRSATWTGLAETDGSCTQRLTDLMVELAQGGVGLIVTGHAYVMKNGQAAPRQLAINCDEILPGLALMTKAVHASGGKIIIQLSHAGMYADSSLTGCAPRAVSGASALVSYPVDELTPDDIEEIIEAFVLAAKRAQESGFDGIQLHAGHGYLLNQFLSPAYNTRTDEYGGAVVCRAFPLLETIRRIRRFAGPFFPILVKLNSRDYLQNGLELNQSLEISLLLENAGSDALEISGGTRESGKYKSARTGIPVEHQEAYFEEAALLFRKHARIPVIQVGGIRSFETAKRLFTSGAADYIAMSRPFICQPDLINRWFRGESKSSTCRSDNECLTLGLNAGGIGCRWSSEIQQDFQR